jgi:hypothetical protein
MCRFQLREVGSQTIVRTMWYSRPDAHQLAISIWTMRTFRLHAHQCLETSTYQDCIRPDVIANRSAAIKSSRRIQCSSASIRTTWQYRPDAIQCSTSNRVSISYTDIGRQLQTVRTMWCSHLNAILGKASRVAEVQPSRP